MPALYPTLDGIHPCVDVAPLLQTNHPARAAVVAQIGQALRERSYFYAANVNVLSADYLAFIYDYSRRVHALPSTVKRQFLSQGGDDDDDNDKGKGAFLGYSGADVGQPELAYNPGTVASVHAWDYSRTRLTDDSAYPDASVIDPPYAVVLDELYERQNILARALMEAFAESLGLPSHVFVDMFQGTTPADNQATEEKDETAQEEKDANTAAGGDFGTIRLLHYPSMDSAAAAKANVGISAHTDFEAFTLMHQSAPGLQLLPPLTRESGDDGQPPAQREWMDAPVRPGEFLVIVGDALERCTNGLFQATPHRVLKTAHARWSIIRFNAFAADTILAPLEKFCDDQRPAAYAPVTMKVHMDTTIQNLELGIGAWDEEKQQSRTANYVYVNGQDHRALS